MKSGDLYYMKLLWAKYSPGIKTTPVLYMTAAVLIQSYTQEHIPNPMIPAVQRARASFVLVALWNVGRGLSFGLINIAFTISK